MRSNTDRKPSRLAPVLAALGTILVVFILVGTMLWAFLSAGGADTIAVGVMVLYGVVGLAVVGGVLAALIQRLREIKRGEEEAVGQIPAGRTGGAGLAAAAPVDPGSGRPGDHPSRVDRAEATNERN